MLLEIFVRLKVIQGRLDSFHVLREFGKGGFGCFDIVISHALASAPQAKYSYLGID